MVPCSLSQELILRHNCIPFGNTLLNASLYQFVISLVNTYNTSSKTNTNFFNLLGVGCLLGLIGYQYMVSN